MWKRARRLTFKSPDQGLWIESRLRRWGGSAIDGNCTLSQLVNEVSDDELLGRKVLLFQARSLGEQCSRARPGLCPVYSHRCCQPRGRIGPQAGDSIKSSIGPPSRKSGAALIFCHVEAEAVVKVKVVMVASSQSWSYPSVCLKPNVVCRVFCPMSAA
jgi:hypothetical protein